MTSEHHLHALRSLADALAIFARLNPHPELDILMSALDDAITALTTAVTANTTATNELIAGLTAAAPTSEQLAAIAAQTAAVTANNTAIANALSPPAPEAPAEPAEAEPTTAASETAEPAA